MTDSSKNLGGEIVDAIVKPVADEAGKMIEVGVQSITGSVPKTDPKFEAKRKQEEATKRRYYLDYFARMAEDEKRIRQAGALKKQETQIGESQEQNKKRKKFEQKNQKSNEILKAAQRQIEVRRGVAD